MRDEHFATELLDWRSDWIRYRSGLGVATVTPEEIELREKHTLRSGCAEIARLRAVVHDAELAAHHNKDCYAAAEEEIVRLRAALQDIADAPGMWLYIRELAQQALEGGAG